MSVGKIAAGVFLGNVLFAILAGIVFSMVQSSMETNQAIAEVDASAAEVEARRIETCARYKAAVSEKDRDPTVCPD